jgi:nitroreductase
MRKYFLTSMHVARLLIFVVLTLLFCSRSKDILMAEENDFDGIFDRKTVREFSPDKVTPEQIDIILKAAFAAPTGGNQRSCEFIVVTDRNAMVSMKKGNPYSQALDTAPLAIVIAVNTNTAIYPELLVIDAGIAAQSILVQTSKLGLASVPMSIAPQKIRLESVSQALNIPGGVIPHIMICIGRPSPDAVSSASTYFYDERKIHYNKY